MNNVHIIVIAIVVAALVWYCHSKKAENYTPGIPAWLQTDINNRNAAAAAPLVTDYSKAIVKGCNVEACTDKMRDYYARGWYFNTDNFTECKNCPKLDSIAWRKKVEGQNSPPNFEGAYSRYNPQLKIRFP